MWVTCRNLTALREWLRRTRRGHSTRAAEEATDPAGGVHPACGAGQTRRGRVLHITEAVLKRMKPSQVQAKRLFPVKELSAISHSLKSTEDNTLQAETHVESRASLPGRAVGAHSTPDMETARLSLLLWHVFTET